MDFGPALLLPPLPRRLPTGGMFCRIFLFLDSSDGPGERNLSSKGTLLERDCVPELDSVTCCILSDYLRQCFPKAHDSPDSTAILYNQYLCYNKIKHRISYSYIDHVLIPYLSCELHEALLLGAGCHRRQGRPQACMGPAGGLWDVICTSVQSCIAV